MKLNIPKSHKQIRSFHHSHFSRSPEFHFVNPFCHPQVFLAFSLLVCLSLFSCTSVSAPAHDQPLPEENLLPFSTHSEAEDSHDADIHPPLDSFSMDERMLMSTPPSPRSQYSNPDDPVFSFRAQGMLLSDALALFARTNNLNIVAGPDVKGEITVDFHGLPLDEAMESLLDAHGYYWEKQEKMIRVHRFETRVFNLDYIRLVRGGTGENKAQITSGSGGGGAAQGAGEITVNQQDEIKFWEELEDQVKILMSKEGRLVINRLSGTLQITDIHHRVIEIATFLTRVRRSMHRQVEIQARIYEVNLKDDYSLGINWNKINFNGTAGNIVLSDIITAPFGGFVARAATTSISFSDGSFDAILEALHEQGELHVVSQPRLITMNNQPALIKVATDQAFFTQTVAQGTAGTGNIITEQARSVTVGLVLSVTPQISEDGWIMMDVTPIISRLREIRESPQKTATAPVLDIKQSSGLVRVRDGEMVLIGGLIQDEVSQTERKVPILGDIPWLGRLFKGTYTAKQKSELVIFLSPRIIDFK